jgi:tetratricopeptide (TPR) repeat protein
MKRLLCLGIGLLLLFPSLLALTGLRRAAPPPERLGYQPSFEVSYFSSLEYRYLLSELLFYDAIFYYGSVLERPKESPDHGMILKYVDSITRLNPYNIDAYYFGQAVLTWDAGMVKEMNHILERGVRKRNWDFYPPFFIGFNYAHFLNDYQSAAKYLELTSKLNPKLAFLPNLVGRLYHQANKTEQAIQYLKVIYQGTSSEAVRKGILLRITALETLQFLDGAVGKFRKQFGRPPTELSELVSAHILKKMPPDPYGGTFYYDPSDGRVKTTSNMYPQGAEHERH